MIECVFATLEGELEAYPQMKLLLDHYIGLDVEILK